MLDEVDNCCTLDGLSTFFVSNPPPLPPPNTFFFLTGWSHIPTYRVFLHTTLTLYAPTLSYQVRQLKTPDTPVGFYRVVHSYDILFVDK